MSENSNSIEALESNGHRSLTREIFHKVRDSYNHIIESSEYQPSSDFNKIWVKSGTDIEVPSMNDYHDLLDLIGYETIDGYLLPNNFAQGGINYYTGADKESTDDIRITLSIDSINKIICDDQFSFSLYAWSNNTYAGIWSNQDQAFIVPEPMFLVDNILRSFDMSVLPSNITSLKLVLYHNPAFTTTGTNPIVPSDALNVVRIIVKEHTKIDTAFEEIDNIKKAIYFRADPITFTTSDFEQGAINYTTGNDTDTNNAVRLVDRIDLSTVPNLIKIKADDGYQFAIHGWLYMRPNYIYIGRWNSNICKFTKGAYSDTPLTSFNISELYNNTPVRIIKLVVTKTNYGIIDPTEANNKITKYMAVSDKIIEYDERILALETALNIDSKRLVFNNDHTITWEEIT